MNQPKHYKAIMLSSTFTDLREHRQRAIEAISKLGYMPRVMEHSGAQAEADVIDTSLNMVRDSAAYVGVIGLKYGQTPFDPDRNPHRLSITELEFNEAVRLDRPIVLFFMGGEHPVRQADIEADPDKRKKLDEFRERAKRMRAGHEVHRVYEVFNSLEQFWTAAAIAVGNLVRQLDRSVSLVTVPAERKSPKALTNVPINVPRHFLGRDDDLAAIDAALNNGDGRAAITALHGLRGVGKTTLAAAYAERRGDNYRATWWIRAETESTMRADLVGLGARLGWIAADAPEEPALVAILEGLRDGGEGVLLVYDNANSPNEVRKYLPRGGAARIIVTSNAPNWGGIAAPVEIEVWPPEVGADYLIARTRRELERGAALALSEALGGLPLAHEQAAAYCERIGVALADYRQRFESAPTKLLDDTRDAARDYHDGLTVAKTFVLAIDEAAKLHPAAEPLIVYAALLAPEPIPLFLFSEAREEFGGPLASTLAGDGLDEAVAALRAFALVDREEVPDERDPDTKTDCIRLHRLVRQVAALRRHDAALEDERRGLIKAMATVYPKDVFNDHKSWPRARRLDALALALVDATMIEGVEKETSHLLDRLASYRQMALAAYTQARPFYERALAIDESVFGPEDPNITAGLVNLAHLMQLQGDYAAAQPLLQRALDIDEATFGPDHPEVAADLNNLAGLLGEQGDFVGARAIHERALAIRELGANQAETAMSLNNLGYVMMKQEDFTAARPLIERALAIRMQVLGADHQDTAFCLNNLGSLLHRQGKLSEARQHIDLALIIFEKALGSSHPITQGTAENLAMILDGLRRKRDASALREKYGIPHKG